MEALFLQILELSLYGSLLILAVLPVRLLLQKAPKWVTCLLWAMVAFALVCPLRFESPASVVPTVNVEQIMPTQPATPALPTVQTEPVMIPELPTDSSVQAITPAQQPDYTAIYTLHFSSDCTKLQIIRTAQGPNNNHQEYKSHYRVLNPEILTEAIPNSSPTPISELLPVVEESLNNGSVNWSAVTLPDSILSAKELQCSVLYPYWVNDKGEIPNNTSLFFTLTYTDGRLTPDYPEGTGIDSLILADTPFTVTVTSVGSQETAKLSIRIDLDTGEILSVASLPVEQPDSSPTGDELQAAIEEHLRNKNRYFANLRILGDAFLDPDNDIYYLLITLDQTRADGTVLSENNLLLVSVIDMGGYLRVDGMGSGTPAQSAGIYPNIAEMNGRLVLWTTRNVNHMKVSEDRLSVISNLSVPNDITKCSIYCENGTVHTWSLMDHGGVFLLPEGDVPISVVPLDAQYNEITALSFNEEYLDPAKVRTVSEESGWDVFLNIDSSDLCGYPTVQSFPLYPDMDDSFNAHAALYSAMKDCDKLPDIAWSTLELAGTLTYEGYEYAAVRCSEGREPMALLIEYQTNADGTVTLRSYAKGYVPDEQGFLTGYYMNQSSMSCGTVYWSLFDTRYTTSKDGKEVDSTKTVEPAFTAFRFTMRDLKTYDFPVNGAFFLAKFSPVIPPAIVTPMEGKTLLAALGSEPMSGLTGTITLTE